MKQNESETLIPLSLAQYTSKVDDREALLKPYENLFDQEIEGVLVKNLESDAAYLAEDDSRIANNLDFIEGLTKDFYLKETLQIMHDMIEEDKKIAQK